MGSLTVDINRVDPALLKGLKNLVSMIPESTLPLRFSSKPRGYTLAFERRSDSPAVQVKGKRVTIRYETPAQAFRALGVLSGQIKKGRTLRSFQEIQRFSLVSIMLDVSRNAAAKPEVVKKLLAHFALMGINGFMLYTETNYEIPGEPFWGYNIGGYTMGELKELDRFSRSMGIEMFPCIQTLAHLRRALHWEAYRSVRDTETVLMVDERATYELIEKMIRAATRPFRSKRIHIGMDEAWDLGMGNYLKKRGYTEPHQLMKRHLKKVLAITAKYDLKPMMWADMFFRAGSATGAYYDRDVILSQSFRNSIPEDVSLVYWDYYHSDTPTYLYWIDRHLELVPRERLTMAPGAQTWSRFWANYPYAFATVKPAVEACKKKGIGEIILTAWGDDGNECDLYSMLPVAQFFADHAYSRRLSLEGFRDNLLGTCGIRFDEWESAGRLDCPPFLSRSELQNNISKALLWEDPLFGIIQPLLEGLPLSSHFASIAEKLERFVKSRHIPRGTSLTRGKTRSALDRRLVLPYQLARVLSVKCDLPSRLHRAYNQNDRRSLEIICGRELPFLRREVRRLWRIHRDFWYETFRAHGWETLENRYGGLHARLQTAERRIRAYLSGRLERIEELEGKRLAIFKLNRGELPTLSYADCYTATPSAVD
jgi:hexosaminidase